MIAWTPAERAKLARLNAASVERSFVPARDVAWTERTSHSEWLALYRVWSVFPGSRLDARLSDEGRANFARYQQASLMLVTAALERHALPMLADLLRESDDPDYVEYVGHFVKEETYHYVMFTRAVDKIEDEMPGCPRLPRTGTERFIKLAYRFMRWVPGRRIRTMLSFTTLQFAERVSVHARDLAKGAVPRGASFVPHIWALHAVDEVRHLQFDRLLLRKLGLGPATTRIASFLAVPFCLIAVLAVHLNEAWAARQLGMRVRVWRLIGPLSPRASPFQKRVGHTLREVVRSGTPTIRGNGQRRA